MSSIAYTPRPILWIEDNPVRFRAHVKRIETETGREVHVAPTLGEASALLEAQEFDLLIVDIILVDEHLDSEASRDAGLRFVEERVELEGWREDPAAPSLLFFTGVIDYRRKQRMRAQPRSRILGKPAHMDRVVAAVLRALEDRNG